MKTERQIRITTPYVTLGQFLKLADIIDSGGQAKAFLRERGLHVNDVYEQRRGRKLYPGDLIVYQNISYRIVA